MRIRQRINTYPLPALTRYIDDLVKSALKNVNKI